MNSFTISHYFPNSREVSGKIVALVFALCACFLITGCASRQTDPQSEQLSGRILLWHTWGEAETATLVEILGRFTAINPQVSVQQQRFTDLTEMQLAFETAADSGLGPDLLLAPSSWIATLADQNLISPLDGVLPSSVLERFTPATQETTTYRGRLYGLPMSLNTMALYYYPEIVQQPPATLDALLAEAAAGNTVALATNFADAFWGVAAFGGRLMDDEHRVVLDQGGFANWLEWLKHAREAPGMLLDSNREILRARFLAGDAVYYIGSADEFNLISASLEDTEVGIAPLPAGPNGGAAPLLRTNAFLFSTASSTNQRRLALALARFLTNTEQQATLMRTIRQVPANQQVRINPRLNPNIANFAAQARFALPVTNAPEWQTIFTYGNDAYTNVLEGISEAAVATAELTALINEINGVAPLMQSATACQQTGTIRLWHLSIGSAEATVLETLIERFQSICPEVVIQTELVNERQISEEFQVDAASESEITILLASQSVLRTLLEQQQVADITQLVGNEMLQRFRPEALTSFRHAGSLYGLPLSLEPMALYYNPVLVTIPAQSLAELRTQGEQGLPIMLDTRFEQAYWGVGGFGGTLYDENFSLAPDPEAIAAWLEWLLAVRAEANIWLTEDGEQLKAAFMAGESAYLVGGPVLWTELRSAMGPAGVAVTRLPTGPVGEASPLLTTRGLLLPVGATPEQLALGLTLLEFMTNQESQLLWAEEIGIIPANANVELSGPTVAAQFLPTLAISQRLGNGPTVTALLAAGSEAFSAALYEDKGAADAAAEFVRVVEMARQADTPVR